ncbi:MAG: tetratricopeptide repeat protein [Kofleriaceae bacterium]
MRIDPRHAVVVLVGLVALGTGATPAHAQRPNQAEDESAGFVAEGREALREGELDDAAKALDQAIALNPRRIEAYVLRSAVYAARKQYRAGVALMKQARALAPNDLDVLTALGSELVLAGDTGEGVPLLAQVVVKDPGRYDAQLLLGHYWHDAASWTQAITAFEAYFAHRPGALAKEDARHQVELADAYLRAHRAPDALALFARAERAKSNATQLRARLGTAWAMAAIDCRRARPLLHDLEPVAPQHPEVWLVDGQCALALGDPGGALDLGRRFLDRGPKAAAAGHALVGEAQAARGNLAVAREELAIARGLEPAARRFTIKLAIVLRHANRAGEALAALDQLGPPSAPSVDPAWYVEVGEARLAAGDAAGAVARLAPVMPELATYAPIHVTFGAAQLAAGQAEAAANTLELAQRLQATPRGKQLLVDALVIAAVAKLSANDAAAAEPMLARADQLDARNPLVWRDLGAARLALDKPAEALPVLDRAAKAGAPPIVVMLDARAHALTGDLSGARALYDRALAADPANVEISLDWAASEVAGGDPAIAVTALEKTAVPANTGPLANRHRQALAIAHHAAGLAALRAGNGAKALEGLRAAVAADNSVANRCDLAIAAVAAGDASAALVALKGVTGVTCPFPPPADTQAVPILAAFTEGLDPKRAARSLTRLTALGGKSTGAAAALLGTAIRVVALNAAQAAYHDGKLGAARRYLATARAASTRAGDDELAHDLAVLDLADGKLDRAIAQLERLSSKLPEALVNLGIAYERKGDQMRALDAWRRAKKAGVRFAPLAEWIEAKERIYGGAP